MIIHNNDLLHCWRKCQIYFGAKEAKGLLLSKISFSFWQQVVECALPKMWAHTFPFSFTASQVCFFPQGFATVVVSMETDCFSLFFLFCFFLYAITQCLSHDCRIVRLHPYLLPNNGYKHEDTCCNYVSVWVFICLEPLPLNHCNHSWPFCCGLFYRAVVYSFFLAEGWGSLYHVKQSEKPITHYPVFSTIILIEIVLFF